MSDKSVKYLKRYFRDIADSLVYFSLLSARRTALGIPYYFALDVTRFYFSLPAVLGWRWIRGDESGLLFARLSSLRNARMLRLYLRQWWVNRRQTARHGS